MDMFKEDVNREFSRIKEKLEKANPLNEEDLKIIEKFLEGSIAIMSETVNQFKDK